MDTHSWTQDVHLGSALLDGMPYVTQVQQHVCRKCGETLALPDCKKQVCLALMSFGCEGEKPKAKWKAPMPEKSKEDIEKRDYPAKRNGHEAKKRRK